MNVARREIVLIVDDSPQTLGFLTEALEQAGYSVLIATSGAAALNIAERITPDMVLMDAIMPGMDGFETCRRMKSGTAAAQVPVIFMTGLTETEHVVHALECGGIDYLTKPINIDELRARIKVHLANARAAQSAQIALDASGRHLFAVDRSGQLLWSTPQSMRLVESLAGDGTGRSLLEEKCRQWLHEKGLQRNAHSGTDHPPTETLAASGEVLLQLAYLGSTGPDEFLFRLTSSGPDRDKNLLMARFNLTSRETDVLLWIARGKSNRDIAEILGLSARTVNKHLEQVYIKLGVENRAAAAIAALEVLHDRA